MWTAILEELFTDVQLHPPATSADIARVESVLACSFPIDLRSLLLETDGLEADVGMLCVFPAGRKTIENFLTVRDEMFGAPEYRRLYASFEGLLFFASDGMGGYFAFDLSRSGVIVHWDHEEDTRTECARGGLREFFERYSQGCIE